MKIKLSNVLKYLFCSIDENELTAFMMTDINSAINQAKLMFKANYDKEIVIENDCLDEKGLHGKLEDCAQEMTPGVWVINKKEFIKVALAGLFEKNEKTPEYVLEAKYIKLCTKLIQINRDVMRQNAQNSIIRYTQEFNKKTNDINIDNFAKWTQDNAEQISKAAQNFYEKKNHCVVCGRYVLRAVKNENE